MTMANENPTWGAPRIHGELLALRIEIDETTVSNYLNRFRTGKPPSQAWRTFLENHMHNTFARDFFTVPNVTFRVLYVSIVLLHENRKIVHFNVTANPTAEWTAQQILEACPWQNPYCERVIWSIRKDCVNHLVVLNEDHLKRKLSEYFKYYHEDRTHLGLDKDSPLNFRFVTCSCFKFN